MIQKLMNKDKTKSECRCNGGKILLMSNPPQYRCINCKTTWFAKDETPICRNPSVSLHPTCLCKKEGNHCKDCNIPLGMSHPPSYTCWNTCPCHSPQDQEEKWEEDADEYFKVSVKLSEKGKEIDVGIEALKSAKKFIENAHDSLEQLVFEARQEILQKIKEKIERMKKGSINCENLDVVSCALKCEGRQSYNEALQDLTEELKSLK